jgi:DNA-binding NarL/FixJ family response regulator
MTQPQLRVTQPDELPAPRVDTDSATVLNEAVETLARLRTPYWLGDSGVRLHALASLAAQIEALLPQAIHDARDQGLTWTEIADLLNISATTVQRHHRRRP